MPAHRDFVRKKGGKFVVYSHSGKVLGKHPTREAALKQLGAIEASKARAKKDDPAGNDLMLPAASEGEMDASGSPGGNEPCEDTSGALGGTDKGTLSDPFQPHEWPVRRGNPPHAPVPLEQHERLAEGAEEPAEDSGSPGRVPAQETRAPFQPGGNGDPHPNPSAQRTIKSQEASVTIAGAETTGPSVYMLPDETVDNGDPNQYEMLSTSARPHLNEGNEPGYYEQVSGSNGGPDNAYSKTDPAGDDDFLRAINAGPRKDDFSQPRKDSKILTRVMRSDRGEMTGPKVEANGWLRCEATLTRAGIFKYENPDGSVRRELRLPEEIFKKDSMGSFHLVPVTDDHPEPGWLDGQNAKNYACGSVEHPTRHGDQMRAAMLITDAALVAKVLNREKCQVSNGYFADLEMRSGEFHGEKFDAIQRNIVGNHVAIVDEARAGPEARIKLDSAGTPVVRSLQAGTEAKTGPTTEENMPNQTKRVRIDKVDYEDVPLPAAQAFEKKAAELDEKIEKLKLDRDGLQAQYDAQSGKLDAAQADLRKAQEAAKAARDPKALDALVSARVDLVTKARAVLGDDFKADGMSDREIKVMVVEKASAGFKADGKSDDYVNARFDAAMEASESEGGLAAVRKAINDNVEPTDRRMTLDSEDLFSLRTDALSSPDFRKWSQNRWQEPLSASKRTHKIDGVEKQI